MVDTETFQYSPEEFLTNFQQEILGFEERSEDWYKQAKSADEMWFVVVCDDSREGVPTGLIDFEGKKVLMHAIPAIGGGVPRYNLPQLLSEYQAGNVTVEKMRVVTTQHGSSNETTKTMFGHGESGLTCGLRGVLASPEKQAHIPEGLLKHAGSINFSSDMRENGDKVLIATQELVSSLPGFEAVPVSQAYYDHSQKVIHLIDPDSEEVKAIELGLDKWDKSHQDPRLLVVSLGAKSASLPDGVILPNSVGLGINNDFNSASADPDNYLGAFWEQWYALSHVGGHGEDHNFEHTQAMVVIVDNAAWQVKVEKFISSSDFETHFRGHVAKLGGIYLVNLDSKKVVFNAVK